MFWDRDIIVCVEDNKVSVVFVEWVRRNVIDDVKDVNE